MSFLPHHFANALRRRTVHGYERLGNAPTEPHPTETPPVLPAEPAMTGDAVTVASNNAAPRPDLTRLSEASSTTETVASRRAPFFERMRYGQLAFGTVSPCTDHPVPLDPRVIRKALNSACTFADGIDEDGAVHGRLHLSNSVPFEHPKVGFSARGDDAGGASVHAYFLDEHRLRNKNGESMTPTDFNRVLNEKLSSILLDFALNLQCYDRWGIKRPVDRAYTFQRMEDEVSVLGRDAERRIFEELRERERQGRINEAARRETIRAHKAALAAIYEARSAAAIAADATTASREAAAT